MIDQSSSNPNFNYVYNPLENCNNDDQFLFDVYTYYESQYPFYPYNELFSIDGPAEVNVTINPVNDSPQVFENFSINMNEIFEDCDITGTDSNQYNCNDDNFNPGQSVQSIIDLINVSNIIDYDSEEEDINNCIQSYDSFGIAITNVDDTNGDWYFKNNNSWELISNDGLLVTDNVLVLSNEINIRFNPASEYTGDSNFSFLIWDQSDGSDSGNYINILSLGSDSPFSINEVQANLNILYVDDKPEWHPDFVVNSQTINQV